MIRKLLSVTLLLTSSFILIYGQNPESAERTNQPTQVVINHGMIERFNKAEFDSTALSFQEIMQSYSLDEVKLLVHSYQNSDFIHTDKYGMDDKLAELKIQMDKEDLPIRKSDPLMAGNAVMK